MKETRKIQYFDRPGEDIFPDCDVAELTNILNKVDSTNSGVRYNIALALEKTAAPYIIHEIDPAHWPIKHMCELRDQRKTIIAKDREKTVGMVGFNELHVAPNGQRIFEIRRTTVLPDYRGEHVGRTLRESMIQRLKGIDSDAILFSRIHVDNKVNQTLATSTKFRKISDKEMRELGFSEDDIQDNRSDGYEFFIFNPRSDRKRQ